MSNSLERANNGNKAENIILKENIRGTNGRGDVYKRQEKFNRLDDARLSNTGGAGLGLSIAEEIIHLHGGKITASSQNETIDFVITLPLSA